VAGFGIRYTEPFCLLLEDYLINELLDESIWYWNFRTNADGLEGKA
jgi:hypothetical protein